MFCVFFVPNDHIKSSLGMIYSQIDNSIPRSNIEGRKDPMLWNMFSSLSLKNQRLEPLPQPSFECSWAIPLGAGCPWFRACPLGVYLGPRNCNVGAAREKGTSWVVTIQPSVHNNHRGTTDQNFYTAIFTTYILKSLQNKLIFCQKTVIKITGL